MEKTQKIYDVVIIGAGVAGLSAGMYAGRFNLKTIILGEQPGGIITTTDLVENYPGIKRITGAEMGSVFFEHAMMFGAEFQNETVKNVESSQNMFKVSTGKNVYVGKTVIFATGTEHKKLNVPGEKELRAKGVSYCALCDAAFFKGKTAAIVGGGDTAAIEAVILAGYCAKVYVFVRKDAMRAEPANVDKVMKNPKIEVRFNAEVAEILGEAKVSKVKLKSGEEIPLDGVFVAIGYVPLSDLAKSLGVATDERGFIKVDNLSQTNVFGFFAAGDVTDKPFKQAIIGAAEGVLAVYSAYQYLQRI